MLTLPDQAAAISRVDELRARREQLERDIDRVERDYERALRNPRCAGVEEPGDQLMRLAAAADALDREIRRLEA